MILDRIPEHAQADVVLRLAGHRTGVAARAPGQVNEKTPAYGASDEILLCSDLSWIQRAGGRKSNPHAQADGCGLLDELSPL